MERTQNQQQWKELLPEKKPLLSKQANKEKTVN